MMASLLGNPDAGGLHHDRRHGVEPGGDAPRAQHGRRIADPEIIAPVTMHFSFRLGAELMGIQLVEVDVDDETYLPRIEDVERAITTRTVGLVCSAPGGSFGVLDPVEAFADLAWRKGLYLHVDAAFGGFILPFMRDLGYDVPPFDLSRARRQLDHDRRPQARACCRSRPASSSSTTERDARDDPDRADADPHDVVDEAGLARGRRVGDVPPPGPGGLPTLDGARPHLRDIIADGVTAIPGMRLAAPAVHHRPRLHVDRRSTCRSSTTRWPRTAGARATASRAACRSSACRSTRRATRSTPTASSRPSSAPCEGPAGVTRGAGLPMAIRLRRLRGPTQRRRPARRSGSW